jgi:hypothetical protein
MVRLAFHPVHQITWLTPPLIFILLMSAYGLFKQVAIPTSGYWAGPIVMSLEYELLLGHHAWEITHALLPISATYWLDQAYQWWFFPMVGSMLICSYLSVDPLQRCRFTLCFIGTWIIGGSMLAYLLPASGPIYFGSFQAVADPFIALKRQLAAEDGAIRAIRGSGLFALQGQALLLEKFKTGTIIPGGGISAMPSMHNAVAILVACASFKISRIMGWLLSLFAGVIFVGSIHLGWHYALDGVVSAIVSGGLWFSSGTLIERYERRLHDRRIRPSGGRRVSDRQVSESQTAASVHPVVPVSLYGEPDREQAHHQYEDRERQHDRSPLFHDDVGGDEQIAELDHDRDQRDEEQEARPAHTQEQGYAAEQAGGDGNAIDIIIPFRQAGVE